MADTISYIGRDIEDAIRLGLIAREDIPESCTQTLGNTNGTIVYRLVEDLVSSSLGKPHVLFSPDVGEALKALKDFNHARIYSNPLVKQQTHKVKLMFELLFDEYLRDLAEGNGASDLFREFLDGMADAYRERTPHAVIVRDFIAGMTDDYFLNQCHKRLIPQIKSVRYR
jgi:dGTPase